MNEKGSIDLFTLLKYTNSRHTKDSSCTRIEGVKTANRTLNLLPRTMQLIAYLKRVFGIASSKDSFLF